MKKMILVLTLSASLSAFSAVSALATIMLNFNPGSKYVNVGSTFNVNITADIIASEALVGWGFDLLYDPAQLSMNSVSTSPFWDLIPSAEKEDLTALLLPNPDSPDPGLSGIGVLLATLNFTCLGPGSSTLDITTNPQDLTEGFMTFDGQYAQWQATPGIVEQGAGGVPEPTTILLLSSGLAVTAWLSRRKRNK